MGGLLFGGDHPLAQVTGELHNRLCHGVFGVTLNEDIQRRLGAVCPSYSIVLRRRYNGRTGRTLSRSIEDTFAGDRHTSGIKNVLDVGAVRDGPSGLLREVVDLYGRVVEPRVRTLVVNRLTVIYKALLVTHP
jgi:hypothetical protein